MRHATGSLRNNGTRVEAAVLRLAEAHHATLLRLSLGAVFIWFALPKFKPGLSAMDALAVHTIDALSGHLLTGNPARLGLAILETSIGLGLITGRYLRLTVVCLMFQMMGTLTPLVLFPHQMWKAPLVPTLEGQFIIKNLVLIAAGIAVAATLRQRAAGRDPVPVRLGEPTPYRRTAVNA
jgi:uncharacterized membrane protein YkgB